MIRVLVLAALLAVTACAGATADADADLRGSWEFVSGSSGGTPLPQPSGATATLVVEDTQLRGISFCNSYSGGYTVDGDALAVDGLGGTEMGCDPDVMAAETAYLAVLGAASRISRDGEELVLTGAGVSLRFSRQVPVPDRELVGTSWTLDTLVDGEVASSVLGAATLLLADDGTASGSTGCRSWTGTWQQGGDVLVLAVVQEDRACPPEVDRQDAHVLAVLSGRPRFGITADRLTLTAPDGRGLVYRE